MVCVKLFIERLGAVFAFIFLASVFIVGFFIIFLGFYAFVDEFTSFALYFFVYLTVVTLGFHLVTGGIAFIKWLIIEPIKQSRKGR